jgi:hypothetical protein
MRSCSRRCARIGHSVGVTDCFTGNIPLGDLSPDPPHVLVCADQVYEQTLSLSQNITASRLIGSVLVLLERQRGRQAPPSRCAPSQHLAQRFLEIDHPCEQLLIRLRGSWMWSID